MTLPFSNIGYNRGIRPLTLRRVKNAVTNIGKAISKKTKSLYKKYHVLIIAFVIGLFSLFIFADEAYMWEWIFDISREIWLLCAAALGVIIIFFRWLAHHSAFPIILSVIALVILIIPLIIVTFELPLSYKICQLLDTSSRNEAIKFIAIGMGGVVGAILAASGNRRAVAQEHNNELVRKGNDNVRFQDIVKDLGHDKATVRIAAFYRFFYLAEKKQDTNKKTEKLRKDIFEILCGCLRSISSGTFDVNKNKHEYRIEQQALLDVLFKGKFRGNMKNEQNWIPSGFSADLCKVHLIKLNLSDANLSGANLSDAYLSDADLSGANLSDADLSDADLLGANFSGANLSSINLSDAYLSGANLSGSNLLNAVFSGADLSGADLSGAKFSNTNLSDANLSGADLSGANLSDADLSGANLSDANLSGAGLLGATLTGANFSNTNLSEVDISNTDLSNTDLSNTDLSGTDISKMDLSNVNLSNTNLSGADFSNTDLSNMNLSGADFSNTDLSGADLSGADLSGANITDANLTQTNLTNTQLQDINFEDVSSIEQTKFHGAKIGNDPISINDLPRGKGIPIMR